MRKSAGKKIAALSLALAAASPSLSFAVGELVGFGPRPMGLGGAFTGVSDDGNSVFYNPAGLRSIRNAEIDLIYARPFSGLSGLDLWTGSGVMAFNLRSWGSVGLSWTETAIRTLYEDRVLAVSYAHGVEVEMGPLDGKLLAGANVKQVLYGFSLDDRSRQDPLFRNGDTKSAVSYDMGVQYRQGEDGHLRLGLMVRDMNEANIGFAEEVKQQRAWRAGAAYIFKHIPYVPFNLMPAFDLESVGDRKNYYFGMEAQHPSRIVTLRAGGNVVDGHFRDAAAGLSWVFATRRGIEFQADYVFIVPLEFRESSGSHSMGLGFRYR